MTPDPDHFDETDLIDPDYSDAEITPEMGDNYLSAEIMLPRGGTMVKGRVATRKRDRDGNLDTQLISTMVTRPNLPLI